MTDNISAHSGKVLKPHQFEDLVSLIRDPLYCLLSAPRTQKTPSEALYTQWCWEQTHKPVWWIQPGSLIQKNWQELCDWTELDQERIIIFTGKEDVSQAQVILMSPDRFRLSWRSLPEPSLFVGDETHLYFKGRETKRVKALFSLINRYPNMRFSVLTGSLVSGRLDAAFPVAAILCPYAYPSHESFMAQHSYVDIFTNKVVWTNHELLRQRLGTHAVFRSYESVHGKANVIWEPVEYAEMSPVQKEKYDEFAEAALLELDDAWLGASNGGTYVLRCDQVLNCPEHIELEGKTYNLVGDEVTGKDELLKIHFEDHVHSGEAVLVFARFKEEIERIARLAKKTGLRTGVIHGGVSMQKRFEIDRQFKAGESDCIVGSAATCSVGFTWPHVTEVIHASISYDDSSYLQGTYRAILGGRDKPLSVVTLMYRGAKVEKRKAQVIMKKSEDAWKVDPSHELVRFTF